MFASEFSDEDNLPRKGREHEAAWQNNVDSLYDRLKKKGLCEHARRGSPWRLSETGLVEARRLKGSEPDRNSDSDRISGPEVPDEVDLFRDFRPKDDSEYRRKIKGCDMEIPRAHETLIAKYGQFVGGHGFRPNTQVHPEDLMLMPVGGGRRWLVEAKYVGKNPTRAMREAIAQLLEYRHFIHHEETTKPRLLALFDQPIGTGYVDFLQTLDIDCVCQQGANWLGTARALEAGLAERPFEVC